MSESISIIDILTAIAAIIALGVSIWSAYISKRNLIASAITSNRIEWIKTVRSLIADFLKEYEKKSEDKSELINIYEELMLYFNPTGKTYVSLVNALKTCLDETKEYSIENSCAVISGAQTLLDSTWVRMKREAGISKKLEEGIVHSVLEELDVDIKEEAILWDVNWIGKKCRSENT